MHPATSTADHHHSRRLIGELLVQEAQPGSTQQTLWAVLDAPAGTITSRGGQASSTSSSTTNTNNRDTEALLADDLKLEHLQDFEVIQSLLGKKSTMGCAEQGSTYTVTEAMEALTTCDPDILQRSLGLTRTDGKRLAAAMELHRRLLRQRTPRTSFTRPEAVAEYMQSRLIRDHECFWGLFLNPRSQLIGEAVQVSQGDIDGTDAGPRAFFRAALQRGAHSAIAVHNHPTGDPSPSAADLSVTARLVAAGRLVDVRLQDHVVVTAHGAHVSIRRQHPEVFR